MAFPVFFMVELQKFLNAPRITERTNKQGGSQYLLADVIKQITRLHQLNYYNNQLHSHRVEQSTVLYALVNRPSETASISLGSCVGQQPLITDCKLAKHSCKGDQSFQQKIPKFDPPPSVY